VLAYRSLAMIDLHCHVLAGIDDGPNSSADSLAIVGAAVDAGTDTLVATPHVSRRYPNDSATISAAAERLGALLARDRSPVRLLAGAEIALAKALELDDEELARLSLGAGRWLLLEPPFSPSVPDLAPTVAELQRRGYGIVLAHPERCPALYRDIALLEALVRGGVVTSVTASSLTGAFGGAARSFALQLAGAGLIHNVASDAHSATGRPPEIARHLRRAGLAGLSEWLTEEVPRAILEGMEIPKRPPMPAPRSRWSARSLLRPKDTRSGRSRWPGASR
jgi:protein-tyrosine phosphatase